MEYSQYILIVNVIATVYMTGLIWFVQVVHYPLFHIVDKKQYYIFQQEHEKRTSIVVVVPMMVEMITAILLLLSRPNGIQIWLVWLGLIFLIGVWCSTFLLQVPCHKKLECGFEEHVHRRLVMTNWLRTWLWSLRSVVVTCMLANLT